MNSDLATLVGAEAVPASKYGTEVAHKAVAGSTFLARLQLFQASSGPCKKGKIPIGTYAVVRGKDTIVHLLGDDVSAYCASWRPKAIRILVGGKLEIQYNPNNQKFKKIEIDSAVKDSGCMWGPEYLLYIPAVNEFVTCHFNNPTMRQAASGMLPNVGKAITLRVEYIDKGKHSWHGPVPLMCSTPLNVTIDPEAFRVELANQRDKFNNPKEEEELEDAPADTEDRAR